MMADDLYKIYIRKKILLTIIFVVNKQSIIRDYIAGDDFSIEEIANLLIWYWEEYVKGISEHVDFNCFLTLKWGITLVQWLEAPSSIPVSVEPVLHEFQSIVVRIRPPTRFGLQEEVLSSYRAEEDGEDDCSRDAHDQETAGSQLNQMLSSV